MHLPKFQYSKQLKHARVLVRVDFNVPLEKGIVVDDMRIRRSLPTIKKLIERKAKVILIAHLGRPNGRSSKKYSLEPIAAVLSAHLGKKVTFVANTNLSSIRRSLSRLKPGEVALLENMRFHLGEVKNTEKCVADLASLADMFVLDGFGVAHRNSPSVTGVAQQLPSYAGYLLQEEIAALEQFDTLPKASRIAIIGGAKIETKLPVIATLLTKTETVLIGGAIVNTFLKAKGYTVGKSLVDTNFEFDALQIMKKRRVVTPVDVIVGTKDGSQYRVVDVHPYERLLAFEDEMILDIGPKTIQFYADYIKKAEGLLWNGAMGYFEQSPYHIGTYAIARLIAARAKGAAFGIVGGGETIQAMQDVGMIDDIDFVSTGGGALLEYIAEGTLPGIDALIRDV
jgi:phosphoglycerate kinase